VRIRPKGYHHWEGELRHRGTWRVILSNGFRLGLQQKFSRLMLFSGLSLAALAGLLFYILALLEAEPIRRTGGGVDFLLRFLGITQFIFLDPTRMSLTIWTLVFVRLCQLQLLWLVIVLAKLGSDLIAGDLRTNALPIYFAKPITMSTYLMGKWLVALAFALVVTLGPNLLAYLAGVLLSNSFGKLAQTTGLLIRLIIQGLVVSAVASTIMLALSALWRDRRFVVVAWIALVLLPIAVQAILDEAAPGDYAEGFLSAVSLQRNLERFTYWVLGAKQVMAASGAPPLLRQAAGGRVLGQDLGASLVVLAVVTAVSWLICLKMVRRFQVAAAKT